MKLVYSVLSIAKQGGLCNDTRRDQVPILPAFFSSFYEGKSNKQLFCGKA